MNWIPVLMLIQVPASVQGYGRKPRYRRYHQWYVLNMDDFDAKLTSILETIDKSQLSDTEKADCMAQLDLGLHRLVWPILVAHISEVDLKDAVDHRRP